MNFDFGRIMAAVASFFTSIMGYSPLLFLPFMFIVIGLFFRAGIRSSIRAGLTVGVGFAGLYLVLDYFITKVSPAAIRLAERFGGPFSFVDIGWPAFAGFAFSSPLAFIIIAGSIIANFILLALRLTKTINVNIWDTWEAIICGLIIQYLTKNLLFAVTVGILLCIVHLWVADKYSDWGYMKFYGFPTFSTYFVGGGAVGLVGHLIGKGLDKIPQLSSAKFTPEWIQKKLGLLGEPMFLGFTLGTLLGLAARLAWEEVLLLGVNLAAILVLLPKMIGMVIDGMVPLTEKISRVLTSQTKGKQEIYIGVDVAILCGHPAVLALTIVMIPIYILLALAIPGGKLLPLADLTQIVYLIALVLPTQRGDLMRTMIAMKIISAGAVVLGSYTAPFQNLVAHSSTLASGAKVDAGVKVASWLNAYMPEYAISVWLVNLWNRIGELVFVLLGIALIAWMVFLYFQYLFRPKMKVAETISD